MTPEEYYKKADKFFTVENIRGFLEFQRTHSIVYNDPISQEDRVLLESLNPSELPKDVDLGEVK